MRGPMRARLEGPRAAVRHNESELRIRSSLSEDAGRVGTPGFRGPLATTGECVARAVGVPIAKGQRLRGRRRKRR
jgi:hypothetical protein